MYSYTKSIQLNKLFSSAKFYGIIIFNEYPKTNKSSARVMGHDIDHIENVIFYPDSYVSDSSTATVSSFEKRVAVSAASISDE